jgi:chemotaxis response regulator CheB
MTAGAVGGRKGGTASANKRLRKALKDSPRVKVVASAPANAKERRGAARQQPAPLLLDAKALDVLTTQVVMGVLGSLLTLTSKQRSLCTVAAAISKTLDA